jgi:hypothetical protein
LPLAADTLCPFVVRSQSAGERALTPGGKGGIDVPTRLDRRGAVRRPGSTESARGARFDLGARALHPRIAALLERKLGDVYRAASDESRRVEVVVTPPNDGARIGIGNSMAWVPASIAPFGEECISARLTTHGNVDRRSDVVGRIQIHRNNLIWIGWEPELDDLVTIDWNQIVCLGHRLSCTDMDGGKWRVAFDIWDANRAPDRAGRPLDRASPDELRNEAALERSALVW